MAQTPDKEDDDQATSGISVVSLVYAEAVAAGFEDEQVVREVFAALVAKADYQMLKRLYASVVRKNRERQSIVRRSLRELGYRQEVWAEWPRQAGVKITVAQVTGVGGMLNLAAVLCELRE